MTRLRDIMSSTVVALTPETSVVDAAARLAENNVTGAPVVEAGRIVGVVSNTDLRRLVAEPSGFSPEELRELQRTEQRMLASAARHAERAHGNGSLGPPWRTPRPSMVQGLQRSVADVMTRRIVALEPDADVEQAALLMRREGVHRLLVMDGDVLVGIVSMMDLAKTLEPAAETGEAPSA